jgi:hypothetical protein
MQNGALTELVQHGADSKYSDYSIPILTILTHFTMASVDGFDCLLKLNDRAHRYELRSMT